MILPVWSNPGSVNEVSGSITHSWAYNLFHFYPSSSVRASRESCAESSSHTASLIMENSEGLNTSSILQAPHSSARFPIVLSLLKYYEMICFFRHGLPTWQAGSDSVCDFMKIIHLQCYILATAPFKWDINLGI